MSYKEAYGLDVGDSVIVLETQEKHTVEHIRGTLTSLFILLDNGHAYRHDQIKKVSAYGSK